MTAKNSTPKAKATPREKNAEKNQALVEAYLDLAQSRNTNTWEFFTMTKGFSVRVIKDSIKEGQAISGFTLSDITSTKAQYFGTLEVLQDKFSVSEFMPFSKAISLAGKADVTLKAEGARALVKKSATIEKFIEALPKTTRKARPASEKSAEFKGEILEGTFEDFMEMLIQSATTVSSEERAAWVTGLTATAKLIKAMNTKVPA